MKDKPIVGQTVFFLIESIRYKGKVMKNFEKSSIIEFDSSDIDRIRSQPFYGKIVIAFKDILVTDNSNRGTS